MRYAIPGNKAQQDRECVRLLRTVTGQQARTLDQALQVMMKLADQNRMEQAPADQNRVEQNPAGQAPADRKDGSYENLYAVYRLLGLAGNQTEAELFPQEKRSEQYLQEELNKLWCVLQLHALDPASNLADTYQKWQNDPKACRELLVQKDAEEAHRPDHAENGQKKEPLPLVDKNSPYYEFVSGTVYEELFDRWNMLKGVLNKKQKSLPILNDDMEQLLSGIQLHYIRRSSSGSCLPMTDPERKELADLFGACVKDVSRLEEKEQNIQEFDELCACLMQNYSQLKSLPSAELPPLANVLRGLEAPTFEFQNTQSSRVGNALSSREAVEYIDENGELHRGIFTAENQETNELKDACELFKRYMDQYPIYDDHFAVIIGDNGKRDEYLKFRLAAFQAKKKKDPGVVDAYIDNADWIPQEDKEDEKFRECIKKLAVEVEKNRNRHAVLHSAGIVQKDEISTRSSAMSDVAQLLGFPELLVNSRRVTVKRQGKEIRGVMMETAGPDMADPAYLTEKNAFFEIDPGQFDRKEMLSSLADLQILDYLCANTDRHANNFFMKQDFSDPDQPKLQGVQGIDNDNSFGALKTGGVMRLAKPENLKIITPKMAAAVEAMTTGELEELLKPYHFRKEQVDAASERLTQLQTMIRNGKSDAELPIQNGKVITGENSIHIVKEEEWPQLTLNMLIPPKKDLGIDPETQEPKIETPDNIFYIASAHLIDVKMAHRGAAVGVANRDRAPIQYRKQGLELDSEKLLELQGKEYRKLQDIKKSMDDHGGNQLRDRSKKFRSMYQAFQNYAEVYENMQKLLSGKEEELINPKPGDKKSRSTEEKLAEYYKKLDSARQKLDHEIERYQTKKHFFKIKPENQERINAALELQKLLRVKSESEKFLDSSIEQQKKHKAIMRQKSDLQLAGYIDNQIYSRMKTTLQTNLKAISQNDPVFAKGIEALAAQKRLWDYAHSTVEMGLLGVKTPDSEAQRISVQQLQQAVRQKGKEQPNPEQVRADLETLREYAQELEEAEMGSAKKLRSQIEQLTDPSGKAKISARSVKAVLNTLYQGELQIAEQNKQERLEARKENAKQK